MDPANHCAAPLQILFLDPLLLQFDRQSGHAKLFHFISLLLKDGHRLSYLPENGTGQQRYREALLNRGIAVPVVTIPKKHGSPGLDNNPYAACLKHLLTSNTFSLVYISFWYTAKRWLPTVRRYSPQSFVAVNSHDVHFLREERMARLKNDALLLQRARQTKHEELATYQKADLVPTVTELDRQVLLRENPDLPVMVIPNVHNPIPAPPAFEAREHLLFVGNYHHLPNVDAALYLGRQVFPYLAKEIPGVKLFLVGSNPTPEISRLASKDIIVTGFVPDLNKFFNSCRVFVAPIRYGAGMKGKIGEALAHGLPVVTTPTGAEGMHLQNGFSVLLADNPVDMAKAMTLLYHSKRLWATLSVEGQKHVAENYRDEIVQQLLWYLLQLAA